MKLLSFCNSVSIFLIIILFSCVNSKEDYNKKYDQQMNLVFAYVIISSNPYLFNNCQTRLRYEVIEKNQIITGYIQKNLRVNTIKNGDRIVVTNTANNENCIASFGFDLCDSSNNQYSDFEFSSKICTTIDQRVIDVRKTEKIKTCEISSNYSNRHQNLTIAINGSLNLEKSSECTYTLEVK